MFGKGKINDPYNTMGTAPAKSGMAKARKKTAPLSEQARSAQAQCLRKAGYGYDAEAVEMGLVEYDPDWLETLRPDSAPKGYPQRFSW